MTSKEVLIQLSQILKNNDIVWGIGGSYLLYLHDLYDSPHDIDLWVHEDCMPKVKELFSEFREIKTHIPVPVEMHYKIEYYGIEVEFIAGFFTKPNQYHFSYRINEKNIEEIQIDTDETVPCTYLEEWYIVYKLLNRNDKAKIIKDYFNKYETKYSDRLDRIKEIVEASLHNSVNKVPNRVIEDVYSLISSLDQLSIFDKKSNLE